MAVCYFCDFQPSFLRFKSQYKYDLDSHQNWTLVLEKLFVVATSLLLHIHKLQLKTVTLITIQFLSFHDAANDLNLE